MPAVLAAARALADYFEAAVKAGAPGESRSELDLHRTAAPPERCGKDVSESPVTPGGLAALISKVESGEITGATGKKVFARMFETGKTAAEIIAAEGYSQINDTGEIERIARGIVAKNADNVAKYRSGNEGVFKFFVGQVMRETRGQANPQAVNDILKRILSES